MKPVLLITLMMACGGAMGQKPDYAGELAKQAPWINANGYPPKPLKCGKYQHVYHWPGSCGPASCDVNSMTCNASCSPVPPDRCVDDLHTITEKEWQELMAKLKELTSSICVSKGGSVLVKCAKP